MDRKLLLPLGLALAILALSGGLFFLISEREQKNDTGQQTDEATNPTIPNVNNGVNEPYQPPTYNVGSYEPYDASKLTRAKTGKVVLFFRATWCPTCKELHEDIGIHLEQIPGDVTILTVDYDTATDLKQKYGVTYQHTLVQVDADGKELKQWNGSPTLAALLAETD